MKCSLKFGRVVAHKNTQIFFTWKVENKMFKASVLWMNKSRIHWNIKIARDYSAVKIGCNDSDVAFHSLHRKGLQSKLLFFLSKGGRCSSWGLLYCDDRRSPLRASHNGPQHDRICSDTVMISTNCNSYASLVIFFIIPVLHCFVFEYETSYTVRMLAVFYFYYRT